MLARHSVPSRVPPSTTSCSVRPDTASSLARTAIIVGKYESASSALVALATASGALPVVSVKSVCQAARSSRGRLMLACTPFGGGAAASPALSPTAMKPRSTLASSPDTSRTYCADATLPSSTDNWSCTSGVRPARASRDNTFFSTLSGIASSAGLASGAGNCSPRPTRLLVSRNSGVPSRTDSEAA